ncbi:MAG: winged helix-turn-helix transcriptional regulator [Actinomycetota bacterium]
MRSSDEARFLDVQPLGYGRVKLMVSVIERRRAVFDSPASLDRPARGKVLIAVPDSVTAAELAVDIAREGLVPVLAFTSSQVVERLRDDPYVVILLGPLGDLDQIRAIIGVATAPVLTLGVSGHRPLAALVEQDLPSGTRRGEVIARLIAVAQISRPVNLPSAITWGPLELNTGTRTAKWQKHPLALTSIQFRILEVLVLAAGSVVTSTELSRHIWGPHTYDDRERILAHVRRIRKKIETDPSSPEFLLTVRGEGFRLVECEIEEPTIDLSLIERGALP